MDSIIYIHGQPVYKTRHNNDNNKRKMKHQTHFLYLMFVFCMSITVICTCVRNHEPKVIEECKEDEKGGILYIHIHKLDNE